MYWKRVGSGYGNYEVGWDLTGGILYEIKAYPSYHKIVFGNPRLLRKPIFGQQVGKVIFQM